MKENIIALFDELLAQGLVSQDAVDKLKAAAAPAPAEEPVPPLLTKPEPARPLRF